MATLKVLIVTNEAKKETKVIIQKKKFWRLKLKTNKDILNSWMQL